MSKVITIFLNALPVLVMIGLIPLVSNDYLLTLAYLAIIAAALCIKHERADFIIFIMGFLFMIGSEYLFISTGVETFVRTSLFGVMPLWLPFLWGYGFIAIKRTVEVIK